jgi:hypothetical protein
MVYASFTGTSGMLLSLEWETGINLFVVKFHFYPTITVGF